MSAIWAAWLAVWDALWQTLGLRCTQAQFRRQEQQIARDWELYAAGLRDGRTKWDRC